MHWPEATADITRKPATTLTILITMVRFTFAVTPERVASMYTAILGVILGDDFAQVGVCFRRQKAKPTSR